MAHTPAGLLTARDVADRLGLHERTVRRMIGRGEIDATFLGGRWLLAPDAVDAVLNHHGGANDHHRSLPPTPEALARSRTQRPASPTGRFGTIAARIEGRR